MKTIFEIVSWHYNILYNELPAMDKKQVSKETELVNTNITGLTSLQAVLPPNAF